jgi:Uma2 family endonuclease
MMEIPAIGQRVMRLSVEDYHRLPERPVELLHGTLVEKMSKSPLHFATTVDLVRLLQPQVPGGWVLRQEGPLTFADSEPEPDIAIVRGPEDAYRDRHPGAAELVIEVAVSSLDVDRVKARIYAEAGVPEYWIVRPQDTVVEIYRDPTATGYVTRTLAQAPESLATVGAVPLHLNLAALFRPGP